MCFHQHDKDKHKLQLLVFLSFSFYFWSGGQKLNAIERIQIFKSLFLLKNDQIPSHPISHPIPISSHHPFLPISSQPIPFHFIYPIPL